MLTAFILSCLFTKAADDSKTVNATINAVTVYRNGAELTHKANAFLPQGSSELIIEGISNTIDINSLQINCPSIVTILGVEFSNQFMVNDKPSVNMIKLQDSLDLTEAGLQAMNINIITAEDLLSVLKANKDIKGSQTGLSVAELVKLMDYYKLKSNELQESLSVYKLRATKLRQVQAKLTQQLTEERKRNTYSAGRIILQLSAAMSGANEFSIACITPNASWIPYYDIKLDNIKSPLKIVYKAKVNQTTGIDWNKVKLSLSTSTPSQYGAAPLLKSWFLSYINPVTALNKSLAISNTIPGALQGKVAGMQMQEVVVTGYSTVRLRGENSMDENATPMYIVNGLEMPAGDFARISPDAIKNISTLKDKEASNLYGSRAINGVVLVTLKDGLEDYVTVSESELDITYDIDIPYDVPSNGKQQVATLKEATADGLFKFYAVPKLDKESYLLAEISDWEKLNLLPGEANIIFEGTYVGRSFIDPLSTNDTLNLTIGKDKRVAVKREKLTDYSSVKFLGSNKLQTITYELTVKNNKKEPLTYILKDQYPISTTKEIDVTLEESSGASVNKEIGVLTWQLQMAPGESKKLRMSYSVKYPRGKLLNLN